MEENKVIVNVWKDTVHQEIALLRRLIKKYKYISMDTEFPGVIAKPIGIFRNTSSFAYQQLRCNVNILNLIQLGISISDEFGNRPDPKHTWQFNLYFDKTTNMYSKEAMELLQSANLNFQDHREKGIDIKEFGSLFLTSGLVLSRDVHWIGFHCAYDFAYLIKMMTGNLLPEKEFTFYEFLSTFFPSFIDLKFLIKDSDYMMKGLQEISNSLGITRLGIAHQAGSDALLTSAVFFKSQEVLFNKAFINDNKNKLYGIGLE